MYLINDKYYKYYAYNIHHININTNIECYLIGVIESVPISKKNDVLICFAKLSDAPFSPAGAENGWKTPQVHTGGGTQPFLESRRSQKLVQMHSKTLKIPQNPNMQKKNTLISSENVKSSSAAVRWALSVSRQLQFIRTL